MDATEDQVRLFWRTFQGRNDVVARHYNSGTENSG